MSKSHGRILNVAIKFVSLIGLNQLLHLLFEYCKLYLRRHHQKEESCLEFGMCFLAFSEMSSKHFQMSFQSTERNLSSSCKGRTLEQEK